jgi:hypothetical protein
MQLRQEGLPKDIADIAWKAALDFNGQREPDQRPYKPAKRAQRVEVGLIGLLGVFIAFQNYGLSISYVLMLQ